MILVNVGKSIDQSDQLLKPIYDFLASTGILIPLSVEKIYICDQYRPTFDYLLEINLDNDVNVIPLNIVSTIIYSIILAH